MTSERPELEKAQHPERVHQHLRAALDATATAEKHFHIREALQLLHIQRR